MIIEHSDHGRVEGVERLQKVEGQWVIWSKEGADYCYDRGWREVQEAQNVTGECEIDNSPGRSTLMVPHPYVQYRQCHHLLDGNEWRKVNAVVVPEDWILQMLKIVGLAPVINMTHGPALKEWLTKHQTPVLQIWKGGGG